MDMHPMRWRLPAAYSTEIGRIITEFARVEWALKAVAFNALGINEKQGRLAGKINHGGR